jgi:hypothetical protein
MDMLVSCMNLPVLNMFAPNDLETAATSSKHLVVGRHPAGCTQGIPGHVLQHFISQLEFHAEAAFCSPLCVTRV